MLLGKSDEVAVLRHLEMCLAILNIRYFQNAFLLSVQNFTNMEYGDYWFEIMVHYYATTKYRDINKRSQNNLFGKSEFEVKLRGRHPMLLCHTNKRFLMFYYDRTIDYI